MPENLPDDNARMCNDEVAMKMIQSQGARRFFEKKTVIAT